MQVILASASPRRQELLGRLFERFTVLPADLNETLPPAIAPDNAAAYLSRLKAEHIARQHPRALVIGADTVVLLEGRALGKPRDEADAAAMLRALSGRRHVVCTGVCVLAPDWEEQFCSRTEVAFYPLDEEEIAAYLRSGEPMDKAGAYGIQGIGSRYIAGIQGDYCNVVGLPVAELYQMLRRHRAL